MLNLQQIEVRERQNKSAAASSLHASRISKVLSVISDDALTVPQAARRLGLTRQGAQRVADDLIAAELVEVVDNPDHRTSPLLALTADGRCTLAAITKHAAGLNNRIAETLGATGIQQTRAGVRRLIGELKP